MKSLFYKFHKTELKATPVAELFYIIYDETKCCGVGPITNEKFCPNCGRKIIRKKNYK